MYNVTVSYTFTRKYSLVKKAGSQGNLILQGHISIRTLTKFSYENLILRNIVIAKRMTRASYVVLAVQKQLRGINPQKSDVEQEEKLANRSS